MITTNKRTGPMVFRRQRVFCLAAVLFLSASVTFGTEPTWKPYFRVTYAGNPPTTITYTVPTSTTRTSRIWDITGELYAVVTYHGDNLWSLDLTPEADVIRVDFPWQTTAFDLGNSEDDVFYLPWWSGRAILNSAVSDTEWYPDATPTLGCNNSYPNSFFSPFVIYADDTEAAIVYAANPEPRWCNPLIKQGLATIAYPYDSSEPLAAYANDVYYAYVEHDIAGNAATGDHPWRNAALRYKRFLKDLVVENKLYPRYPRWLREIHGWTGIILSKIEDDPYDPNYVRDVVSDVWNDSKALSSTDLFPWLQLWGWTSPYDVDDKNDNDGGACLIAPWLNGNYDPYDPLDPTTNDPCNPTRYNISNYKNNFSNMMHSRYGNTTGWLSTLVQSIVTNAQHAGYYSRPRGRYTSIFGVPMDDPWISSYQLDDSEQWDEISNTEWFIAYNNMTRDTYHANAYYYDCLGADGIYTEGHPLIVADLLRDPNQLSPDSVIEYIQDVYPSAFLLSGFVYGQVEDDLHTVYPHGPNDPDRSQVYRGREDVFGQQMVPSAFGSSRAFESPLVEFWQCSNLTNIPDDQYFENNPPDYSVYEGGSAYAICYYPGYRIDPSDDSFIDSWGTDTNMAHDFALRSRGHIKITQPKEYEFRIISINRSRFRLDTDNDGIYDFILDTAPDPCNPIYNSECADLDTHQFTQPGAYAYEITYFNDSAGAGDLQLRWKWTESPNPVGIVPSSIYWHEEILERCQFPQLLRYILDDHLAFLGQSNYGELSSNIYNNYWQERTAFLLGMKYDSQYDHSSHISPGKETGKFGVYDHYAYDPNDPNAPFEINPYLQDLVEVRNDVDADGWWGKKLCYRDTEGITNISEGLRVTRFVDAHCNNYFCCDNPTGGTLHFTFGGSVQDVSSATPLSIIDLPYDPNEPCTADPCGLLGDVNCDGIVDEDDDEVWEMYILDHSPDAYEQAYPECWPLMGDMDDDGDVDDDDYVLFQALLP